MIPENLPNLHYELQLKIEFDFRVHPPLAVVSTDYIMGVLSGKRAIALYQVLNQYLDLDIEPPDEAA